MKRISIMFCIVCALTMSACQQPLPPEVAAAVAEAEKTHGHICNDDMLSCELGICPVGRARRAAFEALEAKQQNANNEELTEQANTTEETKSKEEETERNITPSAEQMESARSMMQEPPARSNNQTEAPHPEPVNYVPTYVENSSGVPGRSGLRMGHFAPPEEAVSTGENAAPLPNAAERHGLRSPSLPGSLPMSIDGRTNNAR